MARKYLDLLTAEDDLGETDPWMLLFKIAHAQEHREPGKSELIPFWHIEGDYDLKIERVLPIYPFSSEHQQLSRILKTLAIYRLAFGQPRQTELVEQLMKCELPPTELQAVQDKLLINLSPITYR